MTEAILFSVILVIGLLVTGLTIGSQFVPAKYWYAGMALFAVPQVFLVPVAGIYPSLALLCCLGPLFAYKQISRFWRLGWFKALVFAFLIQAVSLAWSPSPLAGFRHLVYLIPFATAAFVAFNLARHRYVFAQKCLVVALVLSAGVALMVMLFRVSPSIEGSFLGSGLARVVISPNVLGALLDTSKNNILDPSKAGGIFVNANTASAFLGFCAVLAWNLGATRNTRLLRAVAAVDWIAVFFTGSKAGMIAALLVPGLAIVFDAVRARRLDIRLAAFLSFLGAGAAVAAPFAIERFSESGFAGATTSTLSVRQVIWKFALSEFLKNPLGGLGFGGWEDKFPVYALMHGVNPNYPPHNAVMIVWSQSGMVAALCMVAFVILFLQWVWRAARDVDVETRAVGRALLFGATWYWLQAQGENFGFLGEAHVTPLLGLLAGVLLARLTQDDVPSRRMVGVTGRIR